MSSFAELRGAVREATAALNAACNRVARTGDPFDKPAIAGAEERQVLLTVAIVGRVATADAAVEAFKLLVDQAIDIAKGRKGDCTLVWRSEPDLNGRHEAAIDDIAYVVSCRGVLYAGV